MVEIELRDLKEILDDVVVDDHIEFTVEENMAENKATYPYIVHTETTTWYLSKAERY